MAGRRAARAFASVTAPRNLQQVFHDHVKMSPARGRDGVVPDQLTPELVALSELVSKRLRSGSYHFTQYRQLLLARGAGKTPRVISIPTARDRIALKALANLVLEIFPETRASLPQTRVEQVRRAVDTGLYNAFIRLDIRDFYPSILHAEVEAALRSRIRKPEIIRVILAAIAVPTVPDGAHRRPEHEYNKLGVPQGLAISNLLAELVVQPVDADMQQQDCAYFRYVDDVLVLCQAADADRIEARAVDAFQRLSLQCHETAAASSKAAVGPLTSDFDYLGYVFCGPRTSVRRSSLKRVESGLARTFTAYKKQSLGSGDPNTLALQRCLWYVNLTITGCVYKGAARGWLHYFRQTDDLKQLKQLDATVARFLRRFGLAGLLRPKTFMRAYWAIKHKPATASSYVPNFDLFDVEDMRRQLAIVEGVGIYDLTDREVRWQFSRVLDRAVAELERDVGFLS